MKTYKKISENTIEETTDTVSKTIHNIQDLKETKKRLEEKLAKINKILEADK